MVSVNKGATFAEVTRAQFEGAAVFGTSVVRSGEITARKGVIDQSNFQDYLVARINEAPYQTKCLNRRKYSDGGRLRVSRVCHYGCCAL